MQITSYYRTQTGMIQSDTWLTGKLYPKLDAMFISKRPESYGVAIYIGSSNQFKTKKKYKAWLLENYDYAHLEIKIERGEK